MCVVFSSGRTSQPPRVAPRRDHMILDNKTHTFIKAEVTTHASSVAR